RDKTYRCPKRCRGGCAGKPGSTSKRGLARPRAIIIRRTSLDSGPGSPTDVLAPRATFETAANDRGLAALDAFPVARGCHRARPVHGQPLQARDRKSTRLNSSHQIISYAVFCLKKKTHLTTS